ncbi:MAG: FAD-binding protein [Anaerolineae bacterium]
MAQDFRSLKSQLKSLLSEKARLFDNSSTRELYSRDLAELPTFVEKALFETRPHLVVQPGHSDDVRAIFAFAQEQGLAVVPRGIASTAFGAVIPTQGGILVDLAPMNKILAMEPLKKRVRLQAGVKWGDLEQVLRKEGLALATYPSSRYSTIGGWVATGGYGINAFKYGHLGRWIQTLEVVHPDGTTRTWSRDDPEFQHYLGTEGQMGIITAIRLRVRERPRGSFSHLLYFDSVEETFEFILALIGEAPEVAHVQYLEQARMVIINRLYRERYGGTDFGELSRAEGIVEEKHALLIHVDDPDDEDAFVAFLKALGSIREAERYVAGYLWAQRFFPMKAQRLGPTLLASQLVTPLEAAPRLVESASQLGRQFGVTVMTEAYILKSDEGYRVLVMPGFTCDRRRLSYFVCLLLVSMITRLGIRMGGRPYSGGIWNGPFLESRYGQERLAELRDYKKRVDPYSLLNPGKFPTIKSRFYNLPGLMFGSRLFRLGMDLSLLAAPLLGPLVRRLNVTTFSAGGGGKDLPSLWGEPQSDERSGPFPLGEVALRCTGCGDCLAVCPAYLITQDETVIARSKLRLALKLLNGQGTTKLESDRAFLCLYCGECQAVCQSNLPLLQAYEALEEKLAEKHGRPDRLIHDFVVEVEGRPDYHEFVGTTLLPEPPQSPVCQGTGREGVALKSSLAFPSVTVVAPEDGSGDLSEATCLGGKYQIETKPSPRRLTPVSKYRINRAEGCINCAQCARVCLYQVHFRDPEDVRRMAEPVEHRCKACFRCSQECPRGVLSISLNPEYQKLGNGYYTNARSRGLWLQPGEGSLSHGGIQAPHVTATLTPDLVTSLIRQADRGQIPVFGAGYGGAFAGPGFDGMWTDMSEIVRPTRDGIHGREYISTAIDLGRRPTRVRFDEVGQLEQPLPPVLELPIPLLFGPLPFGSLGENVTLAVVRAARQLDTLLTMPVEEWFPALAPYRRWIAPLLTPQTIETNDERIKGARLVELEEGQDPLSLVRRVKAINPRAIVSIRLAMAEGVDQIVAELCRLGVGIVHLYADYNGTLLNSDSLVDLLPQVHNRLVEEGIRDQLTLLLSGGIASAEHVPKAIILGADGVVIDLPYLIALECGLCGDCWEGRPCPNGIEKIDPDWGAQRIINLMASWRNQLLEVLGAMGMREIRRLRGERGRAMFATELVEEFFAPLFAREIERQQVLSSEPS